MKNRTFDEMISYFNITVSEMQITQKQKMELLGMITAIAMKHNESVKHGHWERTIDGDVRCSNCCAVFVKDILYICSVGYPRYCPYCGTKMGEVVE